MVNESQLLHGQGDESKKDNKFLSLHSFKSSSSINFMSVVPGEILTPRYGKPVQ